MRAGAIAHAIVSVSFIRRARVGRGSQPVNGVVAVAVRAALIDVLRDVAGIVIRVLVVSNDRVSLRVFQSGQAIETVVGVSGGHAFGSVFEVSLLAAS